MHADLAALLERSEASSARVREEWARRSDEQKTWQPGPKAWSMAQCLDHLATTGEAYATTIEPAIDRLKGGGGDADAPIKLGWFNGWFIKQTGPGGRALKAPGVFRPSPTPAGVDIIDRFDASQERVRGWIRQCDGLSLNGPKFGSPVTALIRLTLGEGLALTVGHVERHVEQAIRTRQAPGYPD